MKKLTLILALLSNNVLAAGSASVPIAAGTAYFSTETVECNIQSTPPITAHTFSHVQNTFSWSSSAYSTWTGAQNFTSQPPLSNNTNKYIIDDSANNNTTYLTESAVQWGTVNSSGKDLQFYSPDNLLSSYSDAFINEIKPFILASFTYSNTASSAIPPATKAPTTTGYAAYVYKAGKNPPWQRYIVSVGPFSSTKPATQGAYMAYISGKTFSVSGYPNPFPANCFMSGKMSQ